MSRTQNIQMLEVVAQALGQEFCQQVAFVGGCTTALLLTDEFSREEVRYTDDVDLVVHLTGYAGWQRLVEQLRQKGFTQSSEDEVICRMRLGELKVDFMPEDAQTASTEYGEWQTRIGAALTAFNEPELERLYGQVFSSYPVEVVFQGMFLPLWQQLLKTQDVFGRTSEWLLLDGFLRGRVQHRLQLQAADARQCVLVVAMPELCRELELLVAGLLLSRNDRVVRVLAIGQPLEELSLVCEKLEPQAVVLFANHALSTAHQRRLIRLAQTLNCSVSLAGDASEVAQEALAGSSIACLGSAARLMNQRLAADLKATLDS